ncbi:hypothetical protein KR038_001753 [Drosophila bunnanda]|nr:hypothetical protein KR038_001753 [Drosophila bunnanda]
MDISIPFLLDAVVTHVEVFGVPFNEPQQLAVKVKFMGNTLKLTSSRLNVSGFVGNREYEFLSEPEAVRNSLEQLGVELTVSYQGSTLGLASVTFPTEFLGKISPAMNDLLREDTVDLMRRADVVGSISFLLRLTLKCEGVPIDQDEQSHVSCSGQGPTINPQDVMFLVGDPDPLLQIPSDTCSEFPAEEGDERLSLDLQRYRSLNRRVTFPEDDPCPKQKPSFSHLKKLANEFSQIIDSVAERVKQMNCATDAVATPTPATSPSTPKDERWIPVPLRSEPEDLSGVKPIRYCPVCLYSMSWLPKYTPCPRCNTKPRPVLPREDPKEQLTAMQIIAEQLVRPSVPEEDENHCLGPCISGHRDVKNKESEGDECPPCQCTCTAGKICAHCRVRKICEDVYQSAPVPEPPSRVPNPGPDDDFCVIQDSQDDELPYLSRVFHEMNQLYEMHDFKKLSALQLRCQSQTLLPKRSIKELTEALYHGGRPNSHTQEHRRKAGHKRCLPPGSTVSRRHGWNWTNSAEARTKGWRPGAILRTSGHVMRYFLMYKERNQPTYQKIFFDEDHRQKMVKPVLSVCKRNGEIFVTLRPLATLGIKQKPIIFKIVKSHLAVALRQIKRALKDQGFEKCTCHQPLMLCTCRDALEKFELNKALRKECRSRLMEPCPEHIVLTDTSVSDLEFDLDVTPPAGTRWPRRSVCNAVNRSTQTEKLALKLPPTYPVPDDPYYMAVDCAVGDRYMGTSFGLPGEHVFEDGVFGMRGGGPHGPNPMPCGGMRPAWGATGGASGPYAAFGGGGGGRGMLAGRGRRQGARGGDGALGGFGGPGGLGGGAWKGFPGAKGDVGGMDGKGKGKSGPIPVRYPKRFLKPAQEAAKAAKEAERAAAEKKKKGPDMMKYLQQKGTMRRPWNPDEGKDERPRPPKLTEKGPDGLTAFERRRRELMAGPAPLLCQIPRRGKGCQCYPYCCMDFVC